MCWHVLAVFAYGRLSTPSALVGFRREHKPGWKNRVRAAYAKFLYDGSASNASEDLLEENDDDLQLDAILSNWSLAYILNAITSYRFQLPHRSCNERFGQLLP